MDQQHPETGTKSLMGQGGPIAVLADVTSLTPVTEGVSAKSSSVLMVLEGRERCVKGMAELQVKACENTMGGACCLRFSRGGHSSWLCKLVTEVECLPVTLVDEASHPRRTECLFSYVCV